ncbi:MAG: cobalamin-dependent protein [Magnetovibrio sp.]|nr:cobalamin-dependent protein [Magnetovibrio sp.]
MARGRVPRALEGSQIDPGDEDEALKVGIAQINTSFAGANYLPYVAGLLQAYATAHLPDPDRFEFLTPLYKRVSVADATGHLRGADIVGFSLYVWNARLSLAIAGSLKERDPDVFIVCGGPHVPDAAEAFLRDNPAVDLVVHGEGERRFAAVLENFEARDWRECDGVSYLDGEGKFHHHPPGARIRDLDVIPSPYSEGMFDELIRTVTDEEWLVLWETNRGCPFACTFCDWGSATQSKVFQFGEDRLAAELEWIAGQKIEFIFCCDANFGILKRDLDIARTAARINAETGYPKALSVQNTKNATERAYETQKVLADAGLNKGVTLALQTIFEPALESTKRQNISLKTYEDLQHRFVADQVATYSDLILGLPGETYESFADGVSTVIENGQHNRIQFGNLSILPNAAMADLDYRRRHGMETVFTPILNMHGVLNDDADEIAEIQELVIATETMPRAEWRRARAFAWMTAFLHFDKLLQIPFIVLHELTAIRYREMVDAFFDADADAFPVIARVRAHFLTRAADIQDGGPEFCHSPDWLNVWWPDDEYMFIELSTANLMEAFYAEARRLLDGLCAAGGFDAARAAVADAIDINRMAVNQRGDVADVEIEVGSNVFEIYGNRLRGIETPPRTGVHRYRIERAAAAHEDWPSWFREIVWFGNKKGAYLNPIHVL